MMRRILLAGAAAIGLFYGQAAHAQQAVFCTNCSTIGQQLLDYARQFEQLQQEITTAEQEVINTLSLPGTVYRDLTADIQQITTLANQANMLAGNMGTILNAMAVGYPQNALDNWHQWLTNETNAVALAMRTAAQVLNLQPNQLPMDATTLAALDAQALGTGGRQASLQTLAGGLSSVGQGINKQQATVATALQALISYQSTERDKEQLLRNVSDRDLETAWVLQCQAVTALGGALPNNCAGSQ
jgi:P-type conjugative transfer protein TrbJ